MPRAYALGCLAGIGLGFVLASGGLLLLQWQAYDVSGSAGFWTWLELFTLGLGLALAAAPFVFPEPKPETISQPEQAPAAAPARYEQRTFGGLHPGVEHRYRPSSVIEGEWIEAAANFLLWARDLASLSSPTHIGVSCQNSQDWRAIIDPLVEFDSVKEPQRGVETLYVSGWDATRLYNAVLAGWVQFPEKHPPKITPYSVSRVTVDVSEPSLG